MRVTEWLLPAELSDIRLPKVIAFAGSGPGGDKNARTFNGIYKASSAIGYYDDE